MSESIFLNYNIINAKVFLMKKIYHIFFWNIEGCNGHKSHRSGLDMAKMPKAFQKLHKNKSIGALLLEGAIEEWHKTVLLY